MSKLLCCIRKTIVPQTPEEVVRQKVLSYMMTSLGYPESGFVIEQLLSSMPHLKTLPKNLFPNRRADILFFAKDIHPEHALYPLILVECKSLKLNHKVVNQVLSYNYYLKSYIVAIANPIELKVGIKEKDGKYRFVEGLPRFEDALLLTR